MANQRDVFRRMQAVAATKKIVEAMKLIAITKFSRSKKELVGISNFFEELRELAFRLGYNEAFELVVSGESMPPPPSPLKKLLILVTSSSGFCGAYNITLVNYVRRAFPELNGSGVGIDLLVIGKKGLKLLSQKQIPFLSLHFENGPTASELSHALMEIWLTGKYSRVEIVYHSGKNILLDQLLPYDWLVCRPLHGKPHIVEPEFNTVDQFISSTIFLSKLKKILASASTGEHQCRMISMSQASDNASELLKKLNLAYNQMRQSAITKEITEITATMASPR